MNSSRTTLSEYADVCLAGAFAAVPEIFLQWDLKSNKLKCLKCHDLEASNQTQIPRTTCDCCKPACAELEGLKKQLFEKDT
ncbi:hypothetical protein L1987_33923 [Smallanthus sonchifolius]|uniref:Uncharacterized protein n=1 Tax=Smallanthus sonchifolius TaxID=185202 RepID=A0ACB9HSE0_9ASTR|nr:hypothetical protein L1987_33923 [Smallanthus sonchifolius]